MAPPSVGRSLLKPLGELRSPYQQTDYYQHLQPDFSTTTPSSPTPALHDYYQFLATITAMQPPLEDVPAYGFIGDVAADAGLIGDALVDDGLGPDISLDNRSFPNMYPAYFESQQIIANPANNMPTGGLYSHATLKRERDPSENICGSTMDHYGFLHCSATSKQYDDLAYNGPYYYTPNKTRRLMKQEGETEYSRFYRELFEGITAGTIEISDFLDGKLSFSGSHLNPSEEISLQGRSSVDPTSSADLFNCPTSDTRSSVPPQPNPCENISSFPTDHHRFLQRNASSLLYDDVSYVGPYYYTPNKTRRFVMKVEDENAWQRSFREMVASCEDEIWYNNCGATGGHQTHLHDTWTWTLYEYPSNYSRSTYLVNDPTYSGPNHILPCNRQRLATQVKIENECQWSFGELGTSCVAEGQCSYGVSSDGPHAHSHEMGNRSLVVGTFSENAVNDLIMPVISNSDLVNAKDEGEEGNRLSKAADTPKAPTRVSRERRKTIAPERIKPIARERRRPRWLKDYV